MSIDAKTIRGFVCGIVKSSMNCCCRCLQKHPFLSGVVLVFFLLYLFIPSVFNVVIYTSPVIICIVASVKIYSRTQQSKIQYAKRVDENSSSVESKSLPLDHYHDQASRNDDKAETQSHLSRRRNLKDKNKEWEAEGSKEEKAGMNSNSKATPNDALNIVGNLAAVLDEKGNASSDCGESSSENASVDRGIQAQDDKETQSYCKDRGESSSRNESNSEDVQALDQPPILLYSQPSMSDLISGDGQPEKFSIGGSSEVVEVESSDDAEDEDEDGRQRDRNKAVEWTADDQQNLMDLGDSELERNKRLESLIARRRARKLFKMAAEKRGSDADSTSSGQMAPLSIVRNHLLNSPNNQDVIEGLNIPGSAPSVLLPNRNPFDIPYDSSEEKPNLMADSFHQEFSAAQFCRHESFCWGSSFSVDSQQDHHDSRLGPYAADKRVENLRFSKFRTHSDMSTHDQLIDDLLSQEGQAIFRMLSARDVGEGSQAPEQVKMSGESKGGEDIESGDVTAGTTGEKKASQDGESRSSVDRSEIQMDTDSFSEPCSSEASELSFQGNVTTNIESNLEPKADKFPQRLSDRVQNSLTFVVPESVGFHGPSYDSSPSGVDRPRMERLYYREKLPCHSPVYSIASDLQVEVSDVGSPPLPMDGTISPADVESSYDGDFEKDITSGSEEMWGASCHLLGVDENESRSKEVNDISEHDILGVRLSAMKPSHQDSVPPSKLPAQVAEQDRSKTSSLASPGTEIPEKQKGHSKKTDNKVPENVKQVTEEVKKPKNSDALPPKVPHKGVHSEKAEELANTSQKLATEAHNVDDQVVNANDAKISVKHITSTDLPQLAEKIISESSKDAKNTCDEPPEHHTRDHGRQSNSEATGETSKANAGQEDEKSVQESKNEQNITGVGVSGVNQNSDIPILSALQPILVAEQFSNSSSSCSSPRSVLPGKTPKEQIPSSQFDGQMHINVPPSVVDATAGNISMNNEPPEGLILTAPQNSLHLVVNPPNHPSTISSSGIPEGPFVGVVEGTSESLIQPVAAILQPEPSHQSHPGSVDTKGKSKAPPECSPSKPEEKTANSNVPATMMNEEETRNPLGQSTGEDNIIKKANDPVLNEKEYNEQLKSALGSEDASQPQKGKSMENEAIVGPSNSIDGNKSSSVMNGSENIKHAPKPDSSEGKLEATTEASHGGSKSSEASTKPSTPSADTSVKEAQSNPLPQKSSEKVDTKHNVNETVANENSNEKSLAGKENTPDQTKPGKAAAEVDNEQGDEKVANVMTNNKSLTVQEDVAEKKGPSESTAEFDTTHKANEADASKISNNTGLIDQENFADKTKPDEAAAEVDILPNVNEKVANESSNKKSLVDKENTPDQTKPGRAAAEVDNKQVDEEVASMVTSNRSLTDQEDVAEKKGASESTAEFDTKHKANETEASKMSNNISLIDQENAADKTKPDKAAAEVDIFHNNMNVKAANVMTNNKSLTDQEDVAEKKGPSASAAEVVTKHKANEKDTNKMSNNTGLIDQENCADKTKPDNAAAVVDTLHNVNEKVANESSNKKSLVDKENTPDQTKPGKAAAEVDSKQGDEEVANVMTSNKSLTDQEDVAEKKGPSESAAEVVTKHKANETDPSETSNNTSLIDQENAADKIKPDKAAAEVDILHNVNEKVANESSNTTKLVNQENAVDEQKPAKESDSLKTSEDTKSEPDDLKKDNVMMDKLPEHNIAGEPSKQVESELKSPQKETNTTV